MEDRMATASGDWIEQSNWANTIPGRIPELRREEEELWHSLEAELQLRRDRSPLRRASDDLIAFLRRLWERV
jgi:hypothetical protein